MLKAWPSQQESRHEEEIKELVRNSIIRPWRSSFPVWSSSSPESKTPRSRSLQESSKRAGRPYLNNYSGEAIFEWLWLLLCLVFLRLGHAEHEISELKAAFTRFDQDGNHVLDEKEQAQMRQDLEEERVSSVDGSFCPTHPTAIQSQRNTQRLVLIIN